MSEAKTAEEKKTLGNEAYSNKDFNSAIKLYQEAIDITSSSDNEESLPILYGNLSAAFLAQEKYKEAITASQKCLELDQHFIKAYLRQGTAFYELQDYEQANKVISEGIRVIKKTTSSKTNKKKSKPSGLNELKKLQNKVKSKLNEKNEVKSSDNNFKQLSEEEIKLIQDLQINLQDSLLKGKKAVKEKRKSENELKRIDLTLKQLEALNIDESEEKKREIYLSSGRVFFQKNLNYIKNELNQKSEEITEIKEKMTKMENFYDKRIRSTEKNIREIAQNA